jgi:hypothetical protein
MAWARATSMRYLNMHAYGNGGLKEGPRLDGCELLSGLYCLSRSCKVGVIH